MKTYLAIDLKSFYASVECVDRGLDPLDTNLVVADVTRTEKTICLAVSPSLKAYGISGRARLFEVVEKVRKINAERRARAPEKKFTAKSYFASELKASPLTALSYIAAPPRMARYISYSTKIYGIYLKYIAPEDIHVYSIDEVFMDVTKYLPLYGISAHELAMKIIKDVLNTTGITATAGIGTNLYLCKVAMDIVAKHIEPDKDGVRIAELDETAYKRLLWAHRPLTDFWRVGRGYSKKLEAYGLYTMGDIARCSLGSKTDFFNEDLLYRLFGINAELLIDHAWGWESCTIENIKSYKPENNSLSSGQVLTCPYEYKKTEIIVREMAEMLALDLVDKGLTTDQIVLTVGYDRESLKDPKIRLKYKGAIKKDHYGRDVPKHAHGSTGLGKPTSSARLIVGAAMALFERITDKNLLARRVNITANHVIPEAEVKKNTVYEQLDLFTDYEEKERQQRAEELARLREKNTQKAILSIKKRFGKNAILKGTNLQEGATALSRNVQIGGHKA